MEHVFVAWRWNSCSCTKTLRRWDCSWRSLGDLPHLQGHDVSSSDITEVQGTPPQFTTLSICPRKHPEISKILWYWFYSSSDQNNKTIKGQAACPGGNKKYLTLSFWNCPGAHCRQTETCLPPTRNRTSHESCPMCKLGCVKLEKGARKETHSCENCGTKTQKSLNLKCF